MRLVNSDSLAALNSLAPGAAYFKREDAAQIQESILAFVFAKYLTLRTKHVKGHTAKSDVRSYLNRQVDKMSRQSRLHVERASESGEKEK